MKIAKLLSRASTLLLGAAFTLPAAAQMTYNLASGGNCDFPPYTCNVTGTATVASSMTISGWSAASGANFISTAITDQNGSGVGMSSGGDSGSPNHAIDNNGTTELVMLNFGTNKVVLTGWATGWSQVDADVAILRWTGTTGPDLSSTKVTGAAGLVAKGWEIVKTTDMDGGNSTATQGTLTATTGLTSSSTSSASSWWIVSSFFGGGTLGTPDGQSDYFKLMSVTAHCISNTTGQGCNTAPRGTPEPGSLALAGLALAGIVASRRPRARAGK